MTGTKRRKILEFSSMIDTKSAYDKSQREDGGSLPLPLDTDLTTVQHNFLRNEPFATIGLSRERAPRGDGASVGANPNLCLESRYVQKEFSRGRVIGLFIERTGDMVVTAKIFFRREHHKNLRQSPTF
uniref:Uncharacterized protein n=1 Tax=Romanomermis culicivorax TaxID=13658 RepID=A0A915KDR7_ROMCU